MRASVRHAEQRANNAENERAAADNCMRDTEQRERQLRAELGMLAGRFWRVMGDLEAGSAALDDARHASMVS